MSPSGTRGAASSARLRCKRARSSRVYARCMRIAAAHAFLYGVAVRIASNTQRRRKTALPLRQPEDVGQVSDRELSREQRLEQRQARQLLAITRVRFHRSSRSRTLPSRCPVHPSCRARPRPRSMQKSPRSMPSGRPFLPRPSSGPFASSSSIDRSFPRASWPGTPTYSKSRRWRPKASAARPPARPIDFWPIIRTTRT